MHFLRRVGSSGRINTQAMDSYIEQVAVEEPIEEAVPYAAGLGNDRGPATFPTDAPDAGGGSAPFHVLGLRRPSRAPGGRVFVVASTAGWRLDRFLLREARRRSVPTAAAIISWDNPTAAACREVEWTMSPAGRRSKAEELTLGSDWSKAQVHEGGIPTYDGYHRKTWQVPARSTSVCTVLILAASCWPTHAASSFQISRTWRRWRVLVRSDGLEQPSQLLVRLHPNHFMDNHLFAREREQVRALAAQGSHVHVMIRCYSKAWATTREDTPEKSSMMAHADVFLTVYSTMVVEAALARANYSRNRRMPVLQSKRRYTMPFWNRRHFLGTTAFAGVAFFGSRASSAQSGAEARLEELGIALPDAPTPVANYVSAVKSGNMLYVSGTGPGNAPDGKRYAGKVGRDLTLEEGQAAARTVGLAVLSIMRKTLGSLDEVVRLVKVLGMVNAVPDFTQQPLVVNGFSDLMVEVFGEERGRGARSAVGMGSLPSNIPVEVESIWEVRG